MKYFFLFFLLLCSPVEAGFGVYPPKLEIENKSSFYIVNDETERNISITSEVVEVSDIKFMLFPDEKKEITAVKKADENGVIEILSGEGSFVSGIIIPVEIKKSPEYYSGEKKASGIIPIVIINLTGAAVLGVMAWKKKLF